jgi:hypothetical protein
MAFVTLAIMLMGHYQSEEFWCVTVVPLRSSWSAYQFVGMPSNV